MDIKLCYRTVEINSHFAAMGQLQNCNSQCSIGAELIILVQMSYTVTGSEIPILDFCFGYDADKSGLNISRYQQAMA